MFLVSCVYWIDVTATDQLLAFPENGGLYDNNQDCLWTLISSDPDSQIQIEFNSFNTESYHDYLLVSERNFS